MPRRYPIALSMLFLVSCATVPVTGRKQISLVPASTMLAMSAQEYGAFLEKNPPSKDAAATAMVQRVGKDIQGAVTRFLTEKGIGSKLQGYAWEFHLVESKDVNAWCMPGGKVVVYTGILPLTQDETGLAVVMGHEIAHAVAEHGNERMSQEMLVQFGGVALSELTKTEPEATRELWMTAFGTGAQVGAILPFSRLQENEADHLGLIFMAMAGYDPEAAVPFWQRMAAGKTAGTPEFLSTHPSDATRIQKIRDTLPEAKKYYKKPA